MKRWRNLVPAAGLLLVVAASTSAREWTDNTGAHKTEADLVEVRGNEVVLKKPNGQVISLPIDRLSKSDQEYLESLKNLEPKPENAATAAIETITNSIGMKLKLILPGQFVMGSPASEEKREDSEEQHQLRITRGFYMGVTEVSQQQWLSVMRSRPWREWTYPERERLRTTVGEGGNHPALNLSWEDAVRFCNQLSKMDELSPCYEIKAIARAGPGDLQTIGVEVLPQGTGYRLPTEAEWEYACRAGTNTAYSFGDDKSKLRLYAWCEANSKENVVGEHRVGTKPPNPWGLHDMHGSVYEWCQDRLGKYDPADATDPTGPVQGTMRVSRGGCARAADLCCRSAFRVGGDPAIRQYVDGMRVVRVADPQLAEQ
jgi:formylglycine-generating enzyme required for sulfatase activity